MHNRKYKNKTNDKYGIFSLYKISSSKKNNKKTEKQTICCSIVVTIVQRIKLLNETKAKWPSRLWMLDDN